MASDKLIGHGLKNLEVTSGAGKCACDTSQLKGEASKDSLYGTNSTTEYSTEFSVEKKTGSHGGKPHFGS